MKKMPPKYLNEYIADDKHSVLDAPGGGRVEGYSNIWARLRYVPADSVWFFNILILKKDIIFAHVGIVFLVRSLDILISIIKAI